MSLLKKAQKRCCSISVVATISFSIFIFIITACGLAVIAFSSGNAITELWLATITERVHTAEALIQGQLTVAKTAIHGIREQFRSETLDYVPLDDDSRSRLHSVLWSSVRSHSTSVLFASQQQGHGYVDLATAAHVCGAMNENTANTLQQFPCTEFGEYTSNTPIRVFDDIKISTHAWYNLAQRIHNASIARNTTIPVGVTADRDYVTNDVVIVQVSNIYQRNAAIGSPPLGVLGSISPVVNIFQESNVANDGVTYVIDNRGKFLFSTVAGSGSSNDTNSLKDATTHSTPSIRAAAHYIQANIADAKDPNDIFSSLSSDTVSVQSDIVADDGLSYRICYKKISDESSNWVIVSVIPQTSIHHFDRIVAFYGIYMAAAIILTIILTLVFSNIAFSPLQQVKLDFEKIAFMNVEGVRLYETKERTISFDDAEAGLDNHIIQRASRFTEIRSLQQSFTRMVVILKEIRPFVPQAVLENLTRATANDETDTDALEDLDEQEVQVIASGSTSQRNDSRRDSESRYVAPEPSPVRHSSKKSIELQSSSSSTLRLSHSKMVGLPKAPPKLFVGVTLRDITVLTLRLNNFADLLQQLPQSGGSSTITEIYRDVVQELNFLGTSSKGLVIRQRYDTFSMAWNASQQCPTAAANACTAALQFAEKLEKVMYPHWMHIIRDNATHSARVPSITIGIVSGKAYCGYLGSDSDKAFTILGSIIDRAAQLQAYTTAKYPSKFVDRKGSSFATLSLRIVVDHSTFSAVRSRFLLRPISEVVGIDAPLFEFIKSSSPRRALSRSNSLLSEKSISSPRDSNPTPIGPQIVAESPMVYELMDFEESNKDSAEADEWMYQMIAQQKQDYVAKYTTGFKALQNGEYQRAVTAFRGALAIATELAQAGAEMPVQKLSARDPLNDSIIGEANASQYLSSSSTGSPSFKDDVMLHRLLNIAEHFNKAFKASSILVHSPRSIEAAAQQLTRAYAFDAAFYSPIDSEDIRTSATD